MIINKGFQFILGLAVFWCISRSLGYWSLLSSGIVVLGAALVCMLLPVNFTVFVAAVFILGHLYKLSLAVLIVGALAVFILFIVYIRISPKYGFLVLLVPLCCVLKIPYVIPVALGLACAPVAAVPAGIGVFMHYMVDSISKYATQINTGKDADMMKTLTEVAKVVFSNKEMWLMVIAFSVVTVVVYILRRASFNYNWTVAIFAGVIIDIAAFVAAGPKLGVEISFGALLFGNIIALAIAFILQLIFFTVDFSSTQKVQFEDDDYYYYVKAVPKLTLSPMERKLERLSEEDAKERYSPSDYEFRPESRFFEEEYESDEDIEDNSRYSDEEFEEE